MSRAPSRGGLRLQNPWVLAAVASAVLLALIGAFAAAWANALAEQLFEVPPPTSLPSARDAIEAGVPTWMSVLPFVLTGLAHVVGAAAARGGSLRARAAASWTAGALVAVIAAVVVAPSHALSATVASVGLFVSCALVPWSVAAGMERRGRGHGR